LFWTAVIKNIILTYLIMNSVEGFLRKKEIKCSINLVRYLTRNRVYAMAMKEDTMDLLNYEELNTPTP
jgi:hypothetical protein